MGVKRSKYWSIHKFFGLGGILFIILFSASGIILNHRESFSTFDINRKYLPDYLNIKNFNSSTFKSSLFINKDSILIYGNAGVYVTDSSFSFFNDFNSGFGRGVDQKRVEKLFRSSEGDLFAATLFDLFKYDSIKRQWFGTNKFSYHNRIIDIIKGKDSYLLMSRSKIYKTLDFNNFIEITLANYKNYDNKESAFKTMWVIHSGEIIGTPGKLFVDLLGIVFILLSVSGLIYFLFPGLIKKFKQREFNHRTLRNTLSGSVKIHNKIGYIMGIHLLVLALTGIFLRPPLLILIGNSTLIKIPFTILDTTNAWYDKLRAIEYDSLRQQYLIATTQGVFISDQNFKSELEVLPANFPISVMGVNVFEIIDKDNILLGSFNGLYKINLINNNVEDYIKKKTFIPNPDISNPIGEEMIAGYSNDFESEIYFDYNKGIKRFDNNKIQNIGKANYINQKISLWNLCLEIHTMRIFQSIIGVFYILLIPLSGIFSILLLFSGYVIWYRKSRSKRHKT